jgi:hypothetical protein
LTRMPISLLLQVACFNDRPSLGVLKAGVLGWMILSQRLL